MPKQNSQLRTAIILLIAIATTFTVSDTDNAYARLSLECLARPALLSTARLRAPYGDQVVKNTLPYVSRKTSVSQINGVEGDFSPLQDLCRSLG